MTPIRIAALLAALSLIPAAAQAQTITACYVPKTGSVYRIQAEGAPSACKVNHVAFTWETDVTVGWAERSGVPLTQQVWPNTSQSFFAPCNEGEVPVGGGFSAGGPALVLFDGPYGAPDAGGPVGWKVTLFNPEGGFPFYATARVTCLALPN
ncbi:MAG TPA: hypothetical protein VJ773_00975 [Gemmatimonadales bacterium]|nr:hypothetical protein [Gemmatimonadales bacterium]